jgi:ubiquinone/menaquinone biosynthesis C-methylase UbiE
MPNHTQETGGAKEDSIALPQIEAKLTTHPGVGHAAVTVSRNASGDQKLIAYVVPDENYLDSVLAAEQNEGKRIKEWRTVFDWYQKDDGSSSKDFDTRSWSSSYTRQPIPADEMREWVENTVDEIFSLHPAEILEIGCGTGLLLLRIAPRCKRYVGLDFSSAALKSLRKQLEALDGKQSAVTLLERSADNFEALDNNSFDTVIINSVAQYFPSLEYLTKVLEGALKATKPRGAIFIGDVRSLPLLETFATSVEFAQAPATLRLSELRDKIRRRLNQERELVISPAFFLALQRRYPRISRVEIRPKRATFDNEMTRYRYDAVLFLDTHDQGCIEPRWSDWTSDSLTLAAIRDLLQSGIETLAIKGVVNGRIAKDVAALARLANSDDSATAGDLREALGDTPSHGVSPDQLASIAEDYDYRAEFSLASCRSHGSYDVFLRRLDAGDGSTNTPVAWPHPETIAEDLTLHVHDPSRLARRQMLIRQLRDHLKATLPESMLPAELVLVHELPNNMPLTSDTRW